MVPDNERLPVVVASAQVVQRDDIVDAQEMLRRAGSAALADAAALRAVVDRVSVVNVLSGIGLAPARTLAAQLGLNPARTEATAIGGNTPQWLVHRAADDVASGAARAVLIAGAEAQHSERMQRQAGTGDPPGAGSSVDPDPVVGDQRPGVGPAETGARLFAPVHVYPLFESVLAHRAGRGPAEQRAFLGQVMAPFTEVAAAHPTAWFRQARSADELSTVAPDNRLIAEPYTKRLCAIMAVDQAAAVIVTSLGEARRAGLADRAVFCWSGADANDVWFPSARPDPGRSPAIAAAGRAALGAAGATIDDIDLVDLYSCFPSAVQLAAEALGLALDDRRGLTVTGGLPYFGGPGNNYTLHAIATATDRLRAGGGTALVTGLGWYATKHAVGIYGAAPPPRGWQHADTTVDQQAIDASAVEAVLHAEGPATVVASTVVAGPDGSPVAAPVIARLADGRHITATADDKDLAFLRGRSLVGSTVDVTGKPPTYRVTG